MSRLFIVENCALGRWKINHCEKVIDTKIYLSNTDNCSGSK